MRCVGQLLQFGAEDNRAHSLSIENKESGGESRHLCDLPQHTLEEYRAVGNDFKVRKPTQKNSEEPGIPESRGN